MNEDLLKILDKYNMDNKMGDNTFVNEIAIQIADEYKLHNYLKEVITKGSINGSTYNPFYKFLNIDLNELKSKKFKILLGDDYNKFYNLRLLLSILHEFEHVKQEKELNAQDDSLEHRIIALNNYYYMNPSLFKDDGSSFSERLLGTLALLKYNMYYNRHHDEAPIERLANINANKDMSNIVNSIDENRYGRAIKEFKFLANDIYLEQIKAGYKLQGPITNGPTLDYLGKLKDLKDKYDENSLLERGLSLSFEERLKLGFPLTRKEYGSLEDIKPYTLKYRK